MRRSVWPAGAVALGVALAGVGTVALAARGSSGTYALPSGNPVVAGTVISTTWANNTLGDISAELTDSLSRSGKGGMLAPLRGTDGTATAPALSFTGETGTGLYRIGAGTPAVAVLGTKRQEWTSAGTAVTGTLSTSGLATLNTAVVTNTLMVQGLTSMSSMEVTGVGTSTFAGPIDLGGSKITSLGTPTAAGDAATKGYSDTVIGFVAAAKCHHDGSTQATKGGVTAACAKTTTGTYEVTIAGLTTNGIVLCTAEAGTGVSVCTVAPGTGSATVYTFDGGALADLTFSLMAVKL